MALIVAGVLLITFLDILVYVLIFLTCLSPEKERKKVASFVSSRLSTLAQVVVLLIRRRVRVSYSL